MAIALVCILILGLLLIATETVNHINKAAVAMFVGAVCWLLYISEGTMFVVSQRPVEFLSFLSNHPISQMSVKEFIADRIFLNYIAGCAQIVLFLMATTTIVEVLNNNGCFDFITTILKTRSPRRLLWTLAAITFLISANLDNLTTTILLLSIVHPLISDERLRRIYAVTVVLSANCGGAVSVIGDMTSLKLWVDALVTPTQFFLVQVVPVMLALCTMLWLISRKLPERIVFSSTRPPYRGDDTVLTPWQRVLMLIVGFGGLWFIPTFHRITLMPPFVGALCVLALLWITNEIFNRSLMNSDTMVKKRMPMALQYSNMQNLLYFIGLVLMFGAMAETGIATSLQGWLTSRAPAPHLMGMVLAFLSGALGNVPTVVGCVSLFTDTATPEFWNILNFSSAIGGMLLSTASIAGILVMRMEGVSFGWWFRHVTPKVLAGFIIGYAALCLLTGGANLF